MSRNALYRNDPERVVSRGNPDARGRGPRQLNRIGHTHREADGNNEGQVSQSAEVRSRPDPNEVLRILPVRLAIAVVIELSNR